MLKMHPLYPYYIMGLRVKTKCPLTSNFHRSSTSSYSIQDLQTLGLTEAASKEDIKTAYFKKAKELHPDSSSSGSNGSEEFLRVNEAYRRLMYESKFSGQNHHHNDSWTHNHYQQQHPFRRYNNPDPRYYSPGAQHDRYYNDHRDHRSYGHQYHHDPWERAFRREKTEKEKKMDEVQANIMRRAFLQLLIGVVLVQLFLNVVLGKIHDQMFLAGCDCERCLVTRHQLERQRKESLSPVNSKT